jgi:hypothetical protein
MKNILNLGAMLKSICLGLLVIGLFRASFDKECSPQTDSLYVVRCTLYTVFQE